MSIEWCWRGIDEQTVGPLAEIVYPILESVELVFRQVDRDSLQLNACWPLRTRRISRQFLRLRVGKNMSEAKTGKPVLLVR